MDMNFSNHHLLREENELSDAAYAFVGVQKGNSVNMRNAGSLAASAPARFSSQHTRPGGKPMTSGWVARKVTSARDGSTGPTQPPKEISPRTEPTIKGLEL
jgi:hypothetical protein